MNRADLIHKERGGVVVGVERAWLRLDSDIYGILCSWQVKDALRRISIFPLQFLNLRMEVLLLIESWR
jgi:hypothetical protein